MNLGGTLRINKFSCFTLVFILFLIVYWRSGSSYLTEESDLVNLKTLLKAVIQAAEKGGAKVSDGKNHAMNIQSKGKTREGANDPVTDADYASHCAMYYSLKNTFPKVQIVSEEHSTGDSSCSDQEPIDAEMVPAHHRLIEYMMDEFVKTKDVTIWIDPLDATQEYTEGLYEYVTTMVCVAIRGVPIIGVIHYPFTARTYWGWYTKRTSTNIQNVVQKEEAKNEPRVAISRSHTGQVKRVAIEAFGPKANVSPVGGAGYKVMGVVNGTYDVYLHTSYIKKWDVCAGDAIIKTINGKMTTLKGELIDYSTDSDRKVKDGILVTRYDHDYYLSKLPSDVPSS